MPFSIYDTMSICGQIHDKCCTVGDEIKISKLWHGRTKPLLDAHIDSSISYLHRITKMYDFMAKIDIRKMSLKYVANRNVTYKNYFCNLSSSYNMSSAQAFAGDPNPTSRKLKKRISHGFVDMSQDMAISLQRAGLIHVLEQTEKTKF